MLVTCNALTRCRSYQIKQQGLWRPSHLYNFQCPPPFQHLPVIQGLSRPATISKVHHFPRSLTLPKSTTISKVHHYYHHNQGPPTITKVHHHIPSPPPLLYLWSTTISSTTTNSKVPCSPRSTMAHINCKGVLPN